LFDIDAMPRGDHQSAHNPLSNTYRTSDGRYIALVMLESDRFWAPLVELAGRQDLATDERFVDSAARRANSSACIAELDAMFETRSSHEWREVLARQAGVWSIVQSPNETRCDPQVVANAYATSMQIDDRRAVTVARPPVQFNGDHPPTRPAPELGADTDDLLLALGYDWDQLVQMKVEGAIT
jgi:crotonobetainyl-CoA:carnitine CoA-transferase CaiB-like acyl-CoA transferase